MALGDGTGVGVAGGGAVGDGGGVADGGTIVTGTAEGEGRTVGATCIAVGPGCAMVVHAASANRESSTRSERTTNGDGGFIKCSILPVTMACVNRQRGTLRHGHCAAVILALSCIQINAG